MRKKYEELTFTDDFMFCKVLTANPDLCRELLELVLAVRIKKIVFAEGQKTMETTYDGKGIRLDVYVDDEAGTVYDLEMQSALHADLPKRMRYYQGIIDLNLIERGAAYRELKKSYILFICLADPFGKGLPVYSFRNACIEAPELELGDESRKVILNASGRRDGLSEEMCSFLDYLQKKGVNSSFTGKLQKAVDDAIEHKQWEVEYMTFNLKLIEEREEGRREGLTEGRREGLTEGRTMEIFLSIQEGDYGVERGAKKLGITTAELVQKMEAAGYRVPQFT